MLKRMLILMLIALVIIVAYIFSFTGEFSEYAIKNRSMQVCAVIIVASCIGVSTIIFQTISNNKILTPSIIGLDSLYLLLQSFLVFTLGAINLSVYKENVNFLLSLVCMIFFALLLYKILFRNERSIYLIMLLGLIFGTLFSTLSSFFEVLIDPDEFMIVQGRMFASFDNIALDVLLLASIATIACFLIIFKYLKILNPLILGKDLAINLGIDYQNVVKKLMIIVAVLTSIATALVGPITFLGLIVANITYELFKTCKHEILLFACVFVSMIALVGAIFFVSKVFGYNTTVSVIINFLGGIYFIYLVFKDNKR
ncbi:MULTISPECIES: iron chelate uptake ABC transporter family permease subunit [unclassified Campylobacter]|uniref:iron chelate uptake ABC transporter family permease subunit n=1 Tax=unclassified Campylobacter TaxID=2593542 RepID=UPI0012383CFD|nr:MULTISPECIES: iron chelate uptake ABC transporter family permease subunit [unclassified Campylobacter]KAA6224782.1 iron chelate uptake ABC transporter family permease subunit [Campylobacter sp. LR185c]KAA6227357.1 iron chelate uptake ABC transporter family permease subunit [Campylobacter sp. LR196d]KAA6228734.1 iron chelate uptake ABC transporter family permease subunit [Campylobacter sp. LR286c]KAA6229544.1 iron chelate uptake ABC transporter family permease subunit [Campylobacter sp. LR264